MGVTNYRFPTSVEGRTVLAGGGEFVRGKYASQGSSSHKTDLDAPSGTEARETADGITLYKDGTPIGSLKRQKSGSVWSGYTIHTADGRETGHATTAGSGLRTLADRHAASQSWGKKPKSAPVESRHPGATMSDREFARLQAQRDAAPRGVLKANLNTRVQNELARRKGAALAPVAVGSVEHRVAKQQWAKLSTAATKHGGLVGSTDNGVTEVMFPVSNRAAGFYDQMVSAHLTAEFHIGATTVRVHRPA